VNKVNNATMEITSALISVGREGTPFNRANHGACTFDNRTIWIYGGECTSSSRAFDDLWSYCLVRDEWRKHVIEGADKPGKLTGCSMAASPTGIFIFGGVIFDQPGMLPLWLIKAPDHEVEQVRIERITTFGDGPANMQHSSLIVQSHHGLEYLYIFGGFRALVGAQKNAFRLSTSERRWESLPVGPDARYKSGVCVYQGTILIVGGVGSAATEFGDIWGFNTAVRQWTCWAKQLPRCLNGFACVKNEVLYVIGEARKSNFLTINGYDLLERRLYSFYHKLPEMTAFATCMLGERDTTRKRTNSAPNLSSSSHRSSPKSHQRNLIAPTGGMLGPAHNVDDEGVSLNEVRDQLHKISSVRYDAHTKSVIFNQSATRTPSEQGDRLYAESTFKRSVDYRSVRSDPSDERQKTPIMHYGGYQGPKCLLIIGGKPTKPIFKREPIKLFQLDV